MKINLIKDRDNILNATACGRYVFEVYRSEDNDDELEIDLFNPSANTVEEIGTDIVIPRNIEIQNAVWKSTDYYFPGITEFKDGSSIIDVFRYDTRTKTLDSVYSFKDDKNISRKRKRFKIFILSDTYILIQSEITELSKRDDLMGFIKFDQIVVNLENDEITEVTDENINNNGLNCIIPISSTQIMTKTGCSYIEDDRLRAHSENEALIESVFIHNTSRFIADLSIQSAGIDAVLIESAYYRRHILKPRFKDDYLYFTVAEPEKNSSECVFYNVLTEEQLTCRNEMFDFNDTDICFVVNNTPYVKNTAFIETRFLNLRTMEFDLSAIGLIFLGFVNNIMILKDTSKRSTGILKFFHYPELTQITQEKGTSITVCENDDECYIYIHN